MDPLSNSPSVFRLVTVVVETQGKVHSVHSKLNKLKSAPKEIQAFVHELNDIELLLNELNAIERVLNAMNDIDLLSEFPVLISDEKFSSTHDTSGNAYTLLNPE